MNTVTKKLHRKTFHNSHAMLFASSINADCRDSQAKSRASLSVSGCKKQNYGNSKEML